MRSLAAASSLSKKNDSGAIRNVDIKVLCARVDCPRAQKGTGLSNIPSGVRAMVKREPRRGEFMRWRAFEKFVFTPKSIWRLPAFRYDFQLV